jgi:hypothetical protein
VLCLGYSRRVFLVAEIGAWNAEDVVQGAFQKPRHPGHVRGFISHVYSISVSSLDSAGDHPVRERGHHQVVAGTVGIDHPSRHRNLPSGAHRLKQGCQEALAFTHPPRSPTPNRCSVCTHSASPAHPGPSEPILDPAFAHVERGRQPPIDPISPLSDNPDRRHILADEPPLGAYRVLLPGRANAPMGALHLPIR